MNYKFYLLRHYISMWPQLHLDAVCVLLVGHHMLMCVLFVTTAERLDKGHIKADVNALQRSIR
jgi:hypothetical protein